MSTSSSIERCRAYRRRILEISQKVTAHVAPALSCMEIVDFCYNTAMREQDIFILSKGHGALAQYVVLEEKGLLYLGDYCNGALGGHPDLGGAVMASTGSLGHGLGISVGMAYAERLKGTDAMVYCCMSDGELQEGSTWEAVQMAANLKLSNLILFVDLNDFGGLEQISKSHPAVFPVRAKFEATKWGATMIINGHDPVEMHQAMKMRPADKPFVMICMTVKGKGVSYMVDKNIWHYRSPNKEEYAQALEELA